MDKAWTLKCKLWRTVSWQTRDWFWVCVFRGCTNWLNLHPWLTMANHSRRFFLHAPYSYQITVSRQTYLHPATLFVPTVLSVSSPKPAFQLRPFSPVLLIKPRAQPSIPSFSFSPAISPFIFLLSPSHRGLRWEQRGDRRVYAWPGCLPF